MSVISATCALIESIFMGSLKLTISFPGLLCIVPFSNANSRQVCATIVLAGSVRKTKFRDRSGIKVDGNDEYSVYI